MKLSTLCEFNDGYILVRGNIAIIGHQVTEVAFKNCLPFNKYIREIDGTTIDDAKVLDFFMPMYNLIEYSSIILKHQEVYGFILKNEVTNFNKEIVNTNNFKSFKYKAKLLGNTEAQPNPYNVNGF